VGDTGYSLRSICFLLAFRYRNELKEVSEESKINIVQINIICLEDSLF
jgi:hypothetical protein